MKLSIIIGTGRKDRYSDKVAKFILQRANINNYHAELIDVRDFASPFTIPSWEENVISDKFSQLISKSDAVIIVVPEYNHGYPGELKILLDRSNKEFENKPVGLCGVSSGNFGGTRAIQNIIPILVYLGMNIVQPYLNFSKVEELFDDNENIFDEAYNRRVEKIFKSLSIVVT